MHKYIWGWSLRNFLNIYRLHLAPVQINYGFETKFGQVAARGAVVLEVATSQLHQPAMMRISQWDSRHWAVRPASFKLMSKRIIARECCDARKFCQSQLYSM